MGQLIRELPMPATPLPYRFPPVDRRALQRAAVVRHALALQRAAGSAPTVECLMACEQGGDIIARVLFGGAVPREDRAAAASCIEGLDGG